MVPFLELPNPPLQLLYVHQINAGASTFRYFAILCRSSELGGAVFPVCCALSCHAHNLHTRVVVNLASSGHKPRCRIPTGWGARTCQTWQPAERTAFLCLPSASMSRKVKRPALLTATVRRIDTTCSFANKEVRICVQPGRCVWLRGNSGAGKTQTALMLLGLRPPARGTTAEVQWDSAVQPSERAGMLFQNGVLIDSLTVAENIELAVVAARKQQHPLCASTTDGAVRQQRTCVEYLQMVGLAPEDMHKMPGELSGGMLRRAALAQLLAQRKRLVVLDEPFTGLDNATALGVIEQITRVMKEQKTAFLLISHQVRQIEPTVDERNFSFVAASRFWSRWRSFPS